MFSEEFKSSVIREGKKIRKSFDTIGFPNLPSEVIFIDNTDILFTLNKFDYPYLILSENKRDFILKMYMPIFVNDDIGKMVSEAAERMLISLCNHFEKHTPSKLANKIISLCQDYDAEPSKYKGKLGEDIELVDCTKEGDYFILNIKKSA